MTYDTKPVEPMQKKRKGLPRLVVPLLIILFIFLAPIVPITVGGSWLLPWRNQCGGMRPDNGPGGPPVSVYASVSYVVARLVLQTASNENLGVFGLVIVPSNGQDTVQFPPIGFENLVCS